MNFINIKHHDEKVSFAQAVQQGLGKDQGLFLPVDIKPLKNIEQIITLPFIERSTIILEHLLAGEFTKEEIYTLVKQAFIMPAPVKEIKENVYALELFHGPTLAFKDFGGRFMAQSLNYVRKDNKVTILTATSGDTGAAVAHAFKGVEGINVVILYPQNKISYLQEQLFCTLGDNIHTIAVKSDFDACQALVKQAFDDEELRQTIGLNSANSINISRLLAQVCYYFEAYSQLPKDKRDNLVVSVPSGNFGNLTAGVIAKVLGLNIKRFVAATNVNDTIPRFLKDKVWQVNKTVATLSNAMDVSNPNNWVRIVELFKRQSWDLNELDSISLTDEQTKVVLKELDALGYLCEPHGAIAYKGIEESLQENETGLFLCTAHPAKFKESVEEILGYEIELPETLATHLKLENLSLNFADDFQELRKYLLENFSK